MEKVTATEITENEPKIEKISLSELRAENNKIQQEETAKIQSDFDEKLGKFLDHYMAASDEAKEIFLNKYKK